VRCPDRIPPAAAEFPHGAHPIGDETGTKPSQGTAGRQSASRTSLPARPSPARRLRTSGRLVSQDSVEIPKYVTLSPSQVLNWSCPTEATSFGCFPDAGRPARWTSLQLRSSSKTQSRRGRPLQTLQLPSGGQRVGTETRQDDRPARLRSRHDHTPGVDLSDVPPSQRHRNTASPRAPLSATIQQQNQVDGRQCVAIAGSPVRLDLAGEQEFQRDHP
jgi:hypothetical protein